MRAFVEHRVADVMTYRPTVIGRDTSLAEVVRLFEQHDFNNLPVVDDGSLIGVVTKLDVLKAVAFSGRSLVPPYAEILRLPAERVMSESPATLTPDTPLTAAVQRMVETRYHSLPVVVGALLIGIVAREDVLRALRCALPPEKDQEDEAHGRADLHP